jgi:cytochrome P450
MEAPSDKSSSKTTPSAFFGQAMAENPFPMLTQMRATGPIVSLPFARQGTRQAWLVTRLEESVQILKDKRFSVASAALARDSDQAQDRRRSEENPGLFGRSMISVDGLDHKRLRGLVSKAFTPKYIESLRPQIQQIADMLLDNVQKQGNMDLVHDYGYPLPINVISDMLGVPRKNREQMREWSKIFTDDLSENRERSQRVQNFSTFIIELVAEKRRHPQDDLISQLVHIEEEGSSLSEAELLSTVGLLIFAGHETTSNLIGIGSLMLLDHPDQFARVKEDLSLVPSMVEELLRFNGPVLTPAPRFATEDISIGGQTIQRGDIIITVLASANRDESQFTNPDELDIARHLNRHIAFGQGIHVCLGAPLARLEADIAFTTLLKRMPELHLNMPRETVHWRGGFNLRGVKSLSVAF